ncbi:MAG: sensor histidine kinase [Spirochaetaceae bacterium]
MKKLIHSPSKITLFYILIGAVWLIGTDLIVELVLADRMEYFFAQLSKGLIYIGTTAILVYYLSIHAAKSVEHEIVSERLESNKRLLNAVLESIGDAVLVVNPDGRTITNCNKAAEDIFGYSKEEIVGHSTEMLHIDRERFLRFGEISEAVLEKGEVFRTEYEMRRKDGSLIYTSNTVSPTHEEMGWKAGVISIMRDVTERKKAEQQLRQSLKEKEVMLTEIHHRVKNNLSVINGLLNLQASHAEDKQHEISILTQSQNRIFTMALVHEKLYASNSFLHVDMQDYIETMVSTLQHTLHSETAISFLYDLDEVSVDINQAIPCGLILNELVSNAIIHAFPGRDRGSIWIGLKKIGMEALELKVEDNGIGVPPHIDIDEPDTLGLSVVQALARQINGTPQMETQGGSTFRVIFQPWEGNNIT